MYIYEKKKKSFVLRKRYYGGILAQRDHRRKGGEIDRSPITRRHVRCTQKDIEKFTRRGMRRFMRTRRGRRKRRKSPRARACEAVGSCSAYINIFSRLLPFLFCFSWVFFSFRWRCESWFCERAGFWFIVTMFVAFAAAAHVSRLLFTTKIIFCREVEKKYVMCKATRALKKIFIRFYGL